MARRMKNVRDPVIERLDAVLEILRDLFILAAKDSGLSRDRVRDRLGVDTHRISQVWRHIPGRKPER